MYLIVNCRTKQSWQQKELALDDPIRDNPNFLCFQAREIPLHKDEPLEMCFEKTANSLTGWDEIMILDEEGTKFVKNQLESQGKTPKEIKSYLFHNLGIESQ